MLHRRVIWLDRVSSGSPSLSARIARASVPALLRRWLGGQGRAERAREEERSDEEALTGGTRRGRARHQETGFLSGALRGQAAQHGRGRRKLPSWSRGEDRFGPPVPGRRIQRVTPGQNRLVV